MNFMGLKTFTEYETIYLYNRGNTVMVLHWIVFVYTLLEIEQKLKMNTHRVLTLHYFLCLLNDSKLSNLEAEPELF